jgi:hypothetical protein
LKVKFLKNLIATIAFLVFAVFLIQRFVENYNVDRLLQNINGNLAEKDSGIEKVEETTEQNVEQVIVKDKSEEEILKEAKEILNPYYTFDNIDLERIVLAKDSTEKEKLIALLNRFAVSDLKEIAGEERLNYIKFYDGMKIVGDSNVRHLDYYGVLETEYYYPLPGKNLEYQANHAKDYIDSNTKRLIFWNGYNIAHYNTAEEYIEQYNNLIDSVKKVNPDIDVYICSLMPATEKAIEDDLKGEIPHHIYRGKEYDEALKNYFGDHYINIKFIGKKQYYGNDGIHFMPQFYYMLVPYLAYYLNLD